MPDLIGQQALLTAVLHALRRGRVAHAHLIVGPAGSGKGTLAERIACAQLCTDRRDEGGPCGICRSCVLAAKGLHPDLHWVGREGRLGIDDARALSRAAVLAPHSAPCSAYVVEACERLTGPAAAALLKTLEDPVGPVLFLLLAEHPDQVEPTLRSRCLQVRMRPVAPQALNQWLGEVRPDVPEPLRAEAARRSQGWLGQALSLLDTPPDETTASLLRTGLTAKSPAQIIEAAIALAAGGLSPEAPIAVLRDAWMLRHDLSERVTSASALSPQQLTELAGAVPEDFAALLAAAIESRAAEDANVNASLNWQVLLHRLRGARSAC